jgi:hypothetical protein
VIRGVKFNSDLYVTAATVIPVLFIAVTIGGRPVFADLAITSASNERAFIRSALFADVPPGTLKTEGAKWFRLLALGLFTAVVLAGPAGEIAALVAIDNGTATATQHWIVMAAVIVLSVSAGVAAAWQYIGPNLRIVSIETVEQHERASKTEQSDRRK